MLTSIASITLIAGLALVIVGLVGGGIEVKEVKVPQLPIIPRAASILVGVVLIGLVFFDPGLFGPPAPAPSLDTKSTGRPELGTAITNHLIDVRDVKRVLQHLGMYVGPINNEPDDAYFQAVANFQHSRNIVQDGLVGGETYGKLREAWPGFFDQQQSTPTQATGPSSTPAQATAPSSVQATVFDQTSARPSPGVNCTPSGSQDEHAICGSARLCELDWQLYGVYEASRKRLDKSQQAQLARDESAWVRKRGECLGDERCIAAQYKLRIDQLQSGQ